MEDPQQMLTVADDVRVPASEHSLVVAEYQALREEILKRVEIQHQIISLTLVVAGTFITLGVQATTSPGLPSPVTALLIYPPVAMFLAASWAQCDVRIGQISVYISDRIEKAHFPAGWETYGRDKNLGAKWGPLGLGVLSARGVFVSTQLLSMSLAAIRAVSQSRTDLPRIFDLYGFVERNVIVAALIGLDLIAVLITLTFLRRWRKPR